MIYWDNHIKISLNKLRPFNRLSASRVPIDTWKCHQQHNGRLQKLQIRPHKMPFNREKQDAAQEPECNHVKHFCETNDLNGLVHFSRVTVPVHCTLWNPKEGGVQSVGCEESGVLSGECSV